LWFEEHRKRLTCSNFGKIAKEKNYVSKLKLAERILSFKDITHIESVRYGINEEKIQFNDTLSNLEIM